MAGAMTNKYNPRYLGMDARLKNRIEAFIRSYDLLQAQAETLLQRSKPIDGQPRGGAPGDPVAAAAIQREKVLEDIKAIDTALECIPQEYRAVTWEWCAKGVPLYLCKGSEYAHANTWKRYRKEFLTQVAINKGWWID